MPEGRLMSMQAMNTYVPPAPPPPQIQTKKAKLPASSKKERSSFGLIDEAGSAREAEESYGLVDADPYNQLGSYGLTNMMYQQVH